MIGERVRRIEDRPLLEGRGRFAADCGAPGQLHMRMVRSPVAFGRLGAIDVSQALALPGVAAVWTFEDVRDIPPIDFRLSKIGGLEPFRQTVLASGFVRYVGDPYAVVFAGDAALAEDAADRVMAQIEPLDPYLDATLDPPEFSPGSGDGLKCESAVVRKGYGDLEAAFAAAAHVIDLEVTVGRHSGTPLETRGAFARFDPASGVLTMEGASKVPHFNRKAIAGMIDLPLEMVQLREGHVGGGFGIRGELYPEDVLVCLAAWRLKRPVKWVEDRQEHLVAANHSRGQHYALRAAVDARGVILGLDALIHHDQGGYIRTHAVTVPDLACAMLPGPYRIPAYRVAAHVRMTHKTPGGTYRAPGRYESTFARERLMDAIAARLGLDALELRRRNFIPSEAMPFDRGTDTLGTHVSYDSGDYAGLLTKFESHFRWSELQAELARRRAAGEAVGAGLGFFVEKSGLGPADKSIVTARADGTLEIVTGSASVGQGIETVMAQVAASVLDVPLEAISVVHGQTERIDWGMGAFASRVTVMTGSSVRLACEALLERAAGRPLVQAARDAGGELSAEAWFRTDHMTYPYGIHGAVVAVDPETGGARVERYLVAYDIGRAVNPMLVEGQLAGGAAQGIGGALLEEFIYDESGQPLAVTFADYLLPTSGEVPAVEMLVTEDAPSPLNPLGVKGAGEGGINAAGAAIAAAIDAALGRPMAVRRLPVTPPRLRALVRGA